MSSRRSTPIIFPTGSALAYFGDELRYHREAERLTQEQLAAAINFSESMVGMVETGKRAPKPDFIKRCDEKLRTGGALTRLWKRITESTYPAWFRTFAELEGDATVRLEFEAQVVPGLLQNEDYARAVLRAGRPRDTDEQIEQHVAARLHRQEILTRDKPPLLWVVLDEAVLRRPVGGPEVMRAQLAWLLEASASPDIVLQVLPFAAGEHAKMSGPMTIMTLPEVGDVVYVEGPGSGQIIARPEDVADCALRFDLLRATALSPVESAAMIAEMIGEG
jgi:transcriptional regulator with XRE-family HTH domain